MSIIRPGGEGNIMKGPARLKLDSKIQNSGLVLFKSIICVLKQNVLCLCLCLECIGMIQNEALEKGWVG